MLILGTAKPCVLYDIFTRKKSADTGKRICLSFKIKMTILSENFNEYDHPVIKAPALERFYSMGRGVEK
jgi:hypothetical protein